MLKCDRKRNSASLKKHECKVYLYVNCGRKGIFTDLSIGEPLNFGAIDVKMHGGMKVKEANFLWNSFVIPEND